jgi:hypothetical protein
MIVKYNTFSRAIADFLHRHPCARAVRYSLILITGAACLALYVHPLGSDSEQPLLKAEVGGSPIRGKKGFAEM